MDVKQPNPWAIVIGASSGLGRASAIALAEDGYNLVFVHRDRRQDLETVTDLVADLTSKGVQVKAFNRDATREEAINEILEGIGLSNGAVRLLLYSVSRGNLGSIFKGEKALNLQDFQQTIHGMAMMWWSWTRRILEKGLFAQGATTLAFTSEGGQRHWDGYGAVGASKAVLESLMRSMAVEGGRYGLRANLIQAGITPTRSLTFIPGYEDMLEGNKLRNPMGRNTRPEDVAKAVVWLAGSDAQWVNGAVVPVDGGEHLK